MFHAIGGLCFERTKDGSVRVTKYVDARCKEVQSEVLLEVDSWASVVSSMSRAGETYERWMAAKNFHDEGINAEPEVKE